MTIRLTQSVSLTDDEIGMVIRGLRAITDPRLRNEARALADSMEEPLPVPDFSVCECPGDHEPLNLY